MKIFLIAILLVGISLSGLFFFNAEAQGGGATWKWNVDPSCGFARNAQINKTYQITGSILVYTASIQAGKCNLKTDIRYITGVTTNDENIIQNLIDADLDAWAQEIGTVTINAPQSVRRKGSGGTVRT